MNFQSASCSENSLDALKVTNIKADEDLNFIDLTDNASDIRQEILDQDVSEYDNTASIKKESDLTSVAVSCLYHFDSQLDHVKTELVKEEKSLDYFGIKEEIVHIKDEVCVKSPDEEENGRNKTFENTSLSSSARLHKNDDRIEMYKCTVCGYQTDVRDHLFKHSNGHGIKNPFGVGMLHCRECDYQTLNKYSFKLHISKHKSAGEIKKHECAYCDFQTIDKQHFRKHSLQHRNDKTTETYNCPVCAYETNVEAHLIKHSAGHKAKKPLNVAMLRCDACDYQTLRRYLFKRHILLHKRPDKIHKCKKCEYETPFRANLKKHSVIHTYRNGPIFKCNECNYETLKKRDLSKHLLVHNLEESFTCAQCSYQTTVKLYFDRHMLRHKHVKNVLNARIKRFLGIC